eukprot:s308_g70.t1
MLLKLNQIELGKALYVDLPRVGVFLWPSCGSSFPRSWPTPACMAKGAPSVPHSYGSGDVVDDDATPSMAAAVGRREKRQWSKVVSGCVEVVMATLQNHNEI